ncbi:MAG: PHP domain-containing protein [Ignavibacteriales bacterium]
MKGQLHVHTTYSDGRLTPQEAADTYAQLGFDFIAFTDHDHLLKPSYRKAIEAVRTGLVVFYGIELTVPTRWGYVHVNRIEGDNEVLFVFNHPADYGLSVKQILECIEDVSVKYRSDAVEISHMGFYTPEFDSEKLPYPKVAADDSHTRLGCGRAWIEMQCDSDKDSILKQIKRGGVKCCFVRSDTQTIVLA